MPPYNPKDVKTPRNQIKEVYILHDGTVPGGTEFSIARLVLHNGTQALAMRHDTNYWNPHNIDTGYPSSRGYPTWFLLPSNVSTLISVLNKLSNNGKLNLDNLQDGETTNS